MLSSRLLPAVCLRVIVRRPPTDAGTEGRRDGGTEKRNNTQHIQINDHFVCFPIKYTINLVCFVTQTSGILWEYVTWLSEWHLPNAQRYPLCPFWKQRLESNCLLKGGKLHYYCKVLSSRNSTCKGCRAGGRFKAPSEKKDHVKVAGATLQKHNKRKHN